MTFMASDEKFDAVSTSDTLMQFNVVSNLVSLAIFSLSLVFNNLTLIVLVKGFFFGGGGGVFSLSAVHRIS